MRRSGAATQPDKEGAHSECLRETILYCQWTISKIPETRSAPFRHISREKCQHYESSLNPQIHSRERQQNLSCARVGHRPCQTRVCVVWLWIFMDLSGNFTSSSVMLSCESWAFGKEKPHLGGGCVVSPAPGPSISSGP